MHLRTVGGMLLIVHKFFQGTVSLPNSVRPVILVLPTLFDSFANSFDVFATVVFVKIGSFNIGRRRRVRIIQQTVNDSIFLLVYYSSSENNLKEMSPLYACQDRSDIVSRTPSILQNVQAQLPGTVHIWMEHLTNELYARWPVRILLLEMHHQSKCTILERRVSWPDDDGIPMRSDC